MHAIVVFSLFALFSSSLQLTCIKHDKSAVDWFYMIKFPNKTDVQSGETHRYAYYDSVMSSSGSTEFELRTNYVDIPGEALYETFEQANQDSDYQIIAWNDEPAVTSELGYSYSYSETAHSKGIIIYDSDAGNGIYLPHSTPKYPGFIDSAINVTVGWGQRVYGQNYLCLSLDKENLEKVAQGLLLTGVTVYHNTFTDTSLPNLYNLGQGTPASSSADDYKVIPFKLGSLAITGFFKNPYFESGFIFEDVMVPYLEDSLSVESWGRPYQDPTCDTYETDNIAAIQLSNDEEGAWLDKDDHSKWAITQNKNYVCSGDMNRMTSQRYRGGSFYCFEDSNFWTLMNSIIVSLDSCSSKSFLQLFD